MTRRIVELDKAELKQELQRLGEQGFRADQIMTHLYRQRGWGLEGASNIPNRLKEALLREFADRTGVVLDRQDSSDGETFKLLLGFPDMENSVEAVGIQAPGRATVCVSTQIGCGLGCRFCASTMDGLVRDLHWTEIIEQFLAVNQASPHPVTHVVYMGMGEPLLNYENTVASLSALTDPEKYGVSNRRITVSTIGVVEGIRQLAKEKVHPSLAVSLHAPNQAIRLGIVPTAARWPFECILEAASDYQKETGRQVTLEYCLIAKVNDLKAHAAQLGSVIGGMGFAVNLIAFNPVPGLEWERPNEERIAKFESTLLSHGVTVTRRREKGTDIAAACGQLKGKFRK